MNGCWWNSSHWVACSTQLGSGVCRLNAEFYLANVVLCKNRNFNSCRWDIYPAVHSSRHHSLFFLSLCFTHLCCLPGLCWWQHCTDGSWLHYCEMRPVCGPWTLTLSTSLPLLYFLPVVVVSSHWLLYVAGSSYTCEGASVGPLCCF